MIKNWSFNEADEEVRREIKEFLPEKLFDIHAHIYRISDLKAMKTSIFTEGPGETGIQVWQEELSKQVGGNKLQGGLFIPVPDAEADLDTANKFVINQLKGREDSKGLILISPESNKEKLTEYIERPEIVGFKPYHVFSCEEPTFQASISSYLPEWAWELADKHKLIITLHMVKDKALADSDNQQVISDMCQKYPGVKLILAHAARGFHYPNTIKGIKEISHLQNVWFDTAAVCEAEPILAILREFGPRKILWGTDFPVSQIRGRCVTIGDAFIWNQQDTINWDQLNTGCNPVLVGLESLRALREAADSFGLNEEDITDIFHNNAMRLLGYKKENENQKLYKKGKKLIPGGTQLLSKRPEQLAPEQWPPYFREARGCEIWDYDGHHFYDMSTNGIGSCLLGYREPEVTRAVLRRINMGSMSTLNPPEEVELAEKLCTIHPWAEQARFARTGGEAAAVAVRIARATTDRSVVAICGYHGWHDWYLAANLGESDALRGHLLPGLEPLGVPRELRDTAVTFHYNNIEEFNAIIDEYGDRLAAVIMEPCRHHDPEPGFLEYVKEGIHDRGGLFLFDEITIGWRLAYGGVHLKFGVDPDIAMFAKALGNGYPAAAIIGTKTAMEGAHSSFISSTYWTESIGPTAALATLEKMEKVNVPRHIKNIGDKIKEYWKKYGKEYNLPVEVEEEGYSCLSQFKFKHELDEELKTLYTQLMLERGFLAGLSVYVTLAHTEEIVARYGVAIKEVFAEIAEIIDQEEIKESLKGPVAHSGFGRLLD